LKTGHAFEGFFGKVIFFDPTVIYYKIHFLTSI